MDFSDAATTATRTASNEVPGWYGKLASLGDFAERRLPRDFVECADAWLSRAMIASRAQLGVDWLERYLSAPLLRFAWAPGVFDGAWWFGVLMPSCDNVGRYFPLLVASRRTVPPRTGADLDHLDAWFDHLALAATETLVDGASVDAFEAALASAPRWPGAPATAESPPQASTRSGTGGSGHEPIGTPRGPTGSVRHWLHGTAVAALQARFAGCSIWWQGGDDGSDAAAASILSGLPEPAEFTKMLSAG